MQNTHKYWYILGGILAVLLCIFSLVYDQYSQFPSMCIILGIILAILIDSMGKIPPLSAYDWRKLRSDVQSNIVPTWKALLLVQSKLIFPALFTIYLILLILQKIKIVPSDIQMYATNVIGTLQLLWVTLISAALTNFTGVKEENYELKKDSPINNILTLVLVCLIAYIGMWAIFREIASIGRIAYFVSLSVGILVALVSVMILTENEDEQAVNNEQ